MEQTKWFERKFTLIEDNSLMPTILARLAATQGQIIAEIKGLSESVITWKPSEKWSIKEEIGHLADLEPLWFGRTDDVLNGQIEMRPTDLQNKKTHEANHNQTPIEVLIANFGTQREQWIEKLATLTAQELAKTALHPRMKTPMKIIDLAYFVAEHDDHHLAKIKALKNHTN